MTGIRGGAGVSEMPMSVAPSAATSKPLPMPMALAVAVAGKVTPGWLPGELA